MTTNNVLPHSIRRMLLTQATTALHELLKDESLSGDAEVFINFAQSRLLAAYELLNLDMEKVK